MQTSQPVVFFDGVCGLCNHTVDFLLRKDRRERLMFAPLQGSTAEQTLEAGIRTRLDSLVLLINGKTYLRSSAVVRILWQLPGAWPVLGGLLWLIPWPLRDLGYRAVSAIRYRLFGRKESCRLPLPAERARFLD